MKKKALALAMIIAMLVLVVTGADLVKQVNARIITVPDDFSTIQGAIDAANNGDTVFVKSGYYPETLVINKSISLIGEDREHTIIDAQESNTVIQITESGVAFTDFTLGNTAKPEGYNRWALIKGFDIGNFVANCYIANNRMVSIFGSAFWIPWTAYNNVVKNNVLINCSQLVAFLGGNDTNIFEGNEEVNLTDASSPFPSSSPSPEPTLAPTPSPTTTYTPEPTSTPSNESQSIELEVILGLAVTVAVIGAGLGLLLYFIKRK